MAFGDVWWVQNSQLLKTQLEKSLLHMFTHNDEFKGSRRVNFASQGAEDEFNRGFLHLVREELGLEIHQSLET